MRSVTTPWTCNALKTPLVPTCLRWCRAIRGLSPALFPLEKKSCAAAPLPVTLRNMEVFVMLDIWSADFTRSASCWVMPPVSILPSQFHQIYIMEIHGRKCARYARRTVKHAFKMPPCFSDTFLLHHWWTLLRPTMAASVYLKQERHRLQGA